MIALHLQNLWIYDSKSTSSETKHWVELVKRVALLCNVFNADTHGLAHFMTGSMVIWKELMEWWVKKSDDDRKALKLQNE